MMRVLLDSSSVYWAQAHLRDHFIIRFREHHPLINRFARLTGSTGYDFSLLGSSPFRCVDLNYIGRRSDGDDRGKKMPVRVVESNAAPQVSGFSLLLLPSFESRVFQLRFCLSVNWIVAILGNDPGNRSPLPPSSLLAAGQVKNDSTYVLKIITFFVGLLWVGSNLVYLCVCMHNH